MNTCKPSSYIPILVLYITPPPPQKKKGLTHWSLILIFSTNCENTGSTALNRRLRWDLLGGSSQDFCKWLITMVNFSSPKEGVTFSFPNVLFMAYPLVNKLFNSNLHRLTPKSHFPGLRACQWKLPEFLLSQKWKIIFHQARFCWGISLSNHHFLGWS